MKFSDTDDNAIQTLRIVLQPGTAPPAIEAAESFNVKLDAFLTIYEGFFSLPTVSPMDADYKAARKHGEERASLKFDLTKKLLTLLDERIQVHEVIQQALDSARNEARKNLAKVQADGEAAMAGMFEPSELKNAVARSTPVKEATAIMELHRNNVSALNNPPNVGVVEVRRIKNQFNERLNAWFAAITGTGHRDHDVNDPTVDAPANASWRHTATFEPTLSEREQKQRDADENRGHGISVVRG